MRHVQKKVPLPTVYPPSFWNLGLIWASPEIRAVPSGALSQTPLDCTSTVRSVVNLDGRDGHRSPVYHAQRPF